MILLFKHIITVAITASLLLTLPSCGSLDSPKTSLVTITVENSGSVSLQVESLTVWTRVRHYLAGLMQTRPAIAAIPASIANIRLTVSASDMTSMISTIPVAGLPDVTITIEVPNGLARTFLVEGLDATGSVVYSGQATTDLSGEPVTLAIIMSAISAPTVLSTNPAAGATGIPITAVVSAVFSKAIDPTTVSASTFLLKDGSGTAVSGSVVASGITATFTPSASLAYGTVYAATLTTGFKDQGGLALASDVTWTFTTAASASVADTLAPVFGGLHFTSVFSISSTTLSWTAATDNVSAPANITYLIYQSTTPGGENFASPTYTTTAGAASYTVAGLTPGTVYYFVVRARDEAGNIDSNTAEFSFVYPGKYVSTAGTNTAGCGPQANPCRTIDFALTQTTGNEGLFVSAGTYTAFATLQLKPFTQLACTGSGYSTVILNQLTGGAMLSGNQGALIDGCRLTDPTSSSSPIITDNAFDITVNNCLIQGNGIFSTTAIALSKNSLVRNTVITGFTFNASPGYGVTISGGSPIISNNTFTANNTGIAVSSGTPSIMNNTISNNATGIIISGATTTATITANVIRNNSITGISLPAGAGAQTAIITLNSIDHNGTGLNVQAGILTIRNNDIFCNSTDLFNGLANLDVRNNAWDHSPPNQVIPTCPPGTDICIVSAVTATPNNPVVPGFCP